MNCLVWLLDFQGGIRRGSAHLTFMPSGEEFKKFMEFPRPGKIHQEQPLEQEEMEKSQAAYDIDVALDADMSRIRMLHQP